MPIYLDDKKLAKRLLLGDVAMEIVQMALSRALKKIHSYRGEAALFTWLCMICRNATAEG